MPEDSTDDAARLQRLEDLRANLAAILEQMAALQAAAAETLREFHRIRGIDPPVEPGPTRGAVRCQLCGQGIERMEELVMMRDTVMHAACFDDVQTRLKPSKRDHEGKTE